MNLGVASVLRRQAGTRRSPGWRSRRRSQRRWRTAAPHHPPMAVSLISASSTHDMAGRTYRYPHGDFALPLTATIRRFPSRRSQGAQSGCAGAPLPRPRGERTGRQAVRAIVAGIYRAGLDAPPSRQAGDRPLPVFIDTAALPPQVTADTAAAIPCTSLTGMRSANLSPINTAGALAIIMPSVVPSTTRHRGRILRRQCSRRHLGLVTHLGEEERNHGCTGTRRSAQAFGLGAVELVGTSIHIAMAMKNTEDPAQRVTDKGGDQAPTAPASAWLATVATKMPRMIGQGLVARSQ